MGTFIVMFNDHTSIEKASSGAASTTLMVSLLLGWTVAKPPETRKHCLLNTPTPLDTSRRTKELCRRVARLNDLYNSGTNGLNARDVVGEDTHVTSCGWQVNLNYISRGEKGLGKTDSGLDMETCAVRIVTYLVGKDQGELNFIGYSLSIATTRGGKRSWCPPRQRRGKTKRRHCGVCCALHSSRLS